MKRIFIIMLSVISANVALAQTTYKPFAGEVQSIQLSTGVKLQFVEQGNAKGIPVIMLHGYTDSWHSYETTLPFLPSSMHVFAISQRGHGDSDRPMQNYHPKHFAADVADFIHQKNLGQAVIVGHSLGGVIAQQLVIDYPQLVKALVIVSSDPAFRNNPGLPEFVAEINKLSDPVSHEFADAFQKSTEYLPVDPAFHKMVVAESLKIPAVVWKQIAEGFMSVDYSEELKKVNKPSLIVWGDKDGVTLLAGQKTLSTNIRNAKLLVYTDTGHALHWEQPERFAKDLAEFVSNVAGQPQAK